MVLHRGVETDDRLVAGQSRPAGPIRSVTGRGRSAKARAGASSGPFAGGGARARQAADDGKPVRAGQPGARREGQSPGPPGRPGRHGVQARHHAERNPDRQWLTAPRPTSWLATPSRRHRPSARRCSHWHQGRANHRRALLRIAARGPGTGRTAASSPEAPGAPNSAAASSLGPASVEPRCGRRDPRAGSPTQA